MVQMLNSYSRPTVEDPSKSGFPTADHKSSSTDRPDLQRIIVFNSMVEALDLLKGGTAILIHTIDEI